MKKFRFTFIVAFAAFCSILIYSCVKDRETLSEQLEQSVQNRNLTEDIIITDISAWNCCISAKVRTNISVNPHVPVHTIKILKSGVQIDYVIHGGQYGANWKTDNHPTHPNYWELTWCFDQGVYQYGPPATICLEPEITGANGNSNGNSSTTLSQQYCVNIINCNPVNCGYILCWLNFNALLNEVTGFVLDCGNGPVDYPFANGIATTGGFAAIKQAILDKAGTEIPNWTFTSPSVTGGDCYKGSSPLPSLFFSDSNCKVVSLIGFKDGIKTYIPFKEKCIY